MKDTMTDEEYKTKLLSLIKEGTLRQVRSPKRKRKLQKRGVAVWWNTALQVWLWEPGNSPTQYT